LAILVSGATSAHAEGRLDAEPFWSAPPGAPFFAARSPYPRTGAGLTTSYLRDPIRIAIPTAGPERSVLAGVSSAWVGQAMLAFAATREIGVDVTVPFTFAQSFSPLAGQPGPEFGPRDVRAGISWMLVDAAAVHLQVSLPTGDPASFAGAGRPGLAPSFSHAIESGPWLFTNELGFVLQTNETVVQHTLGSRVFARFGVGRQLVYGAARLRFVLEGRAAWNFVDSEQPSVPFEWTGGAGFRLLQLDCLLGAGTAIPFDQTPPTPTFRAVLRIGWLSASTPPAR
jgi:hypothetical protein